ncbi:YbaN family protein [Shewanella salipaludis]|uniref:Inner membrane protein n=1 Tax=Shewanella salipaludis TaxID=2723052 RepID=A0A972JIS0_9GAMM|nr:YbaN family protein [Shewanella salipaludis]NMH64370.1 DUF454 domain-containing protein [Shewanella salipaludis]
MRLKRGFFLFCGLCSLALGLVGIFLPLLPTVPFILLALFCFARSSKKLHLWLRHHPWFVDSLDHWEHHRAMRRSLKRRALWLTGLSFCVSLILVPLWWLKAVVFGIACGVLLFIQSIPEIDD